MPKLELRRESKACASTWLDRREADEASLDRRVDMSLTSDGPEVLTGCGGAVGTGAAAVTLCGLTLMVQPDSRRTP